MKSRIFKAVILLILLSFVSPQAQAQCPMCRISAESNMKYGGKTGRGLNSGILYMLALPYVLVGTIGYVWWRNRRKEEGAGDSEN
jgi:hypothetical protein